MTATLTDRQQENLSTEERIRQRAHELYLQRGDGAGSELDDWLEAERQIMSESEQERKPQQGIRAAKSRSAA